MAIDDCMYDYLRPSDWTHTLNEYSLIRTVCDKDTDEAEPLYDAINGEICLYTVKRKYPAEDCKRFVEELKSLVIKKVKMFDESNFQGFAGEMSYNEGTLTETERLASGKIVVKDAEIIGGVVFGELYIDYEDHTRKDSKNIFLPIGSEPRETDYSCTITVYGSDGEEDEHICRTFSTLIRE